MSSLSLKSRSRPNQIVIQRQRGISLVLTVVLLLGLSLLSLSAMQSSTLQERMSNNLRDRNIALQAAELALRDAERDLASLLADNATFCPGGGAAGSVTCRPVSARPDDTNLRDGFWVWTTTMRQTWTPDCVDGQCLPLDNATAAVPVWDDTAANWAPQTGSTGTNPTTPYGKYTGATAIPNVAAQPRYIMEIFPPGGLIPDFAGTTGSARVAIRITVRAVGQNPNTVVILQSVVAPH
ncbi:pilus assembly PilX family protein [Undibacterium sp. Ji83W]|uniref:pilus assembly PilX family protein n=1 Tax=Undibacterium sp. Ji83W TaxID=3413043 RepID=UPI003BF2AB15